MIHNKSHNFPDHEIFQLENQLKKDQHDLAEQKKKVSDVIEIFEKDNEKRKEFSAERLAIESELKKTKEKTEKICV